MIDTTVLYVLDLIGVFAFASYGAYRALRKHMDFFGVFICAALTALGGGAIREMIINQQPVFLHNYAYIGVVAVAALFTVITYQHFHRLNKIMLTLDAIGLTTFAFIGADRAAHAGLGIGGMILFAVLTAVGGGVLSDLVAGRPPQVFYGDFYAIPAIFMALLYAGLRHNMGDPIVVAALLISVFLTRMTALYLRWNVWRPHRRRRAGKTQASLSRPAPTSMS